MTTNVRNLRSGFVVFATSLALVAAIDVSVAALPPCNGKVPDDDPGFCKDPFRPCSGYANSLCPAESACTDVVGQYPETPVTTCVDGSGPNTRCEMLGSTVCWKGKACYWDSERSQCAVGSDCTIDYTTLRGSVQCPPDGGA